MTKLPSEIVAAFSARLLPQKRILCAVNEHQNMSTPVCVGFLKVQKHTGTSVPIFYYRNDKDETHNFIDITYFLHFQSLIHR